MIENEGLLSGAKEEIVTEDKANNTTEASAEEQTQGENKEANSQTLETEGTKEEAKAEEKAPEGAPETYEEFSFTEGFQVDEEAKTEFISLAKDLNLSQEKAQQLVTLQNSIVERAAAKQAEEMQKRVGEWRAASEKMYTAEQIGDAVRGFKAAPEEVRNILGEVGLDNHPKFVELFMRYGQSLKEDKFETGKPGGAIPSTAEVLYPGLKQ